MLVPSFSLNSSQKGVNAAYVDDSFRAHIVGRFESIPSTLPLTVGPQLSEPGGATDGFIARLSANGTSFDYCGYVGGSGQEDITLVAADDANGGSEVQSISVDVTDVNDDPLMTSTDSPIAFENLTTVITVTAIDEDQPEQTLTFEITGGEDAGEFSIRYAGEW